MANEFARRLQDAGVNPAARALPNGAATVNGASIDLGGVDSWLADVEFEVVAPALTNTQCASAETVVYGIEDSDDDSDFADLITLDELDQTGAGSGVATATRRFRLPSTTNRYIRLSIVKTGAGNASASTATLTANF